MMIPIFGRENLALTVMVPYDCSNNCPFCSSKALYAQKKADAAAVEETMKWALSKPNLPIRDVVFTGGEPAEDVEMLKKLVALVPDDKNVYINTTLPEKTAVDFARFVNNEPKIKGVNVSRHAEEFWKEQLCDIVPDRMVKFLIRKPVRINCVLNGQDIRAVADRWRHDDVEISLRRDYTQEMTQEELHFPYDKPVMDLIYLGYEFKNASRCNVCDTVRFEKDGQVIAYHKGLFHSSISNGSMLEINDLIIDHTGKFLYDWDGCDEEKTERLKMYAEATKACDMFMTAEEQAKTQEFAKRIFGTSGVCGCTSPWNGGSCGGRASYCGGYSKPTCGGGC